MSRRYGKDFMEDIGFPMFWRPIVLVPFMDDSKNDMTVSSSYSKTSLSTVQDGKVYTQVKENNNGEINEYEVMTDLFVSDPVTNKKRKHVRWKD